MARSYRIMKTLETLLNDLLHDSEEMPGQTSLYYFSNLGTKEAARVSQMWPRLNVELRRRITTKLVELAEADFSLDFNAVFRIGMEDSDAEVRTSAIEGLWEDENVDLIPMLADRLYEDKSVQVRAAAAMSLGRFILLGELGKILPDPYTLAYEALLAACQNREEHMEVRRRALESLSYTDNRTVRALIIEAYAASEEKMRVSAVFAMGRSADANWAKQVQQELFSPNPELRYEAARACGELQLSETVPELEELTEDADVEVQEAALWALGQIGGNRARKILEHYCRTGNEATQAAAIAALNELEFLHGDLSEFFARMIHGPDW